MAFGQGATVLTPIEQAVAYSTFANGGTRYAPQVASQIVDPMTGKVVKKLAPQVTGHVAISPTNYSAILPGARGCHLEPERHRVRGLPGLPGRVEPGRQDRDGLQPTDQEPNSWFVAFGPNPNPQYLVLAVIDQGGYGADAAAPLVRNIFNYICQPDPDQLAGQDADAGEPAERQRPPTNAPLGTPTTTTTTTVPGHQGGGDDHHEHDATPGG